METGKHVPKTNQIYQHHTGRQYQILGVSNLETDEPNDPDWIPQVFYKCLETNKLWSRPLSEFTPDKFNLVH